jgi:MFS family permease
MPAVAARARRLGPLLAVTAAVFDDGFLYGMMVPLSSDSPAGVQDPWLLGVLYGGYALGTLVGAPLFGVLSDRRGPRRPLLWGWGLQALATLLFGVAGGFAALLAGRLCQGAASAASWTAGLALVAERYPDERTRELGVVMMGNTGGLLLGPVSGGFLAQWGGYRLALAVAGGAVAVDGLLRATLVAPAPHAAAPPGELGRLLRDGAVLAAGLFVALAAFSWSLIDPLLPLHLAHHAGISPATVGVLFTVASAAYGLAAPGIAWAALRWGSWPTMVAGGVAMAAGLPLLVLPTAVAPAAAVLVAVNLAYGLIANPALADLGDAVDRRGSGAYGAAYAVYNMAYAVGAVGSDVTTGALSRAVSFEGSLWAVSAALLLSLGLVHLRRRAAARAGVSPRA